MRRRLLERMPAAGTRFRSAATWAKAMCLKLKSSKVGESLQFLVSLKNSIRLDQESICHFTYPATCIEREEVDYFDVIDLHFHTCVMTIKALQELERTN